MPAYFSPLVFSHITEQREQNGFSSQYLFKFHSPPVKKSLGTSSRATAHNQNTANPKGLSSTSGLAFECRVQERPMEVCGEDVDNVNTSVLDGYCCVCK